MKIPLPDEFAEEHGYKPFPRRWERWLSTVRESILSSQPMVGRHVTLDEYAGKGTVVNVERGVGGPPIEPCPTPVTITFEGVTFDCGCTTRVIGVNSYIAEENAFNGFNGVGFNEGFSAFCAFADCRWNIGITTDVYQVDYTFYDESTTCGGTANGPTPQSSLNIKLLLSGGIYHLFAAGTTDGVIFYGTTTNLSLPIANTVSCASSYSTWDNEVTDCIYGEPHDFTAIAHGGTATVAAF